MSNEMPWDEWSRPADGDYPAPLKFEHPGDSIAVTVTRVRVATMPDGKRLPELTIRKDDGEERQVLASQVRLQSRLAELRPVAGDRISIVFTSTEPATKAGRSPVKCFDVALKQGAGAGGGSSAPAAQPAAVASSAADLL